MARRGSGQVRAWLGSSPGAERARPLRRLKDALTRPAARPGEARSLTRLRRRAGGLPWT